MVLPMGCSLTQQWLLILCSLLCAQVPGVWTGEYCDNGRYCSNYCCDDGDYDDYDDYCCDEDESIVGAVVGSLFTIAVIAGIIAIVVCLCKRGCMLNRRFGGTVLSRPAVTVTTTTTPGTVPANTLQMQPGVVSGYVQQAPPAAYPLAPQPQAYPAQPNPYSPAPQQYPAPPPPYQPPQQSHPAAPLAHPAVPPPQAAPPVAQSQHLKASAPQQAESDEHDYQPLRPPAFAPQNEKAPLE